MKSVFVHESSYLEEGAQVGVGTKIWHFSHISAGARIGKKCNIGQNVFIAPGVNIGDNVKIQNNVSVYAGVTVEDDAFLGPSMVFTNVINPRSHISRKEEFQSTLVKRGVSIGANSTVICGVTLGQYAFVGAGAVIARDVPDYALVYGNPAKIEGWVCRCGVRLHFDAGDREDKAACDHCGTHYMKKGDMVRAREEQRG